jgi:hypothetical protein
MKTTPTAGRRRGQKTTKRMGGRADVSTMPSVAPMSSPAGKDTVSPETVKAVILAGDNRAILIAIGATARIMDALKKAKLVKGDEWAESSGTPVKVDVSFDEEELKLIGAALGWLTLRLPEKSQGGRRLRGGVAPAVAAVVGLVTFLFASFSGNNIYTLNVNRETVRQAGIDQIRAACPVSLLEPAPAARPGWFGYMDPRDVQAATEFATNTALCATVRQNVAARVTAAEQAYTNAWNAVPAGVTAVGAVAAVGLGAPPAIVSALGTLTGVVVSGSMPTTAQLQTTVDGVSGLLPPPAPPAPSPGGRRKTKRRVTRRRKAQKVLGTPVFVY